MSGHAEIKKIKNHITYYTIFNKISIQSCKGLAIKKTS